MPSGQREQPGKGREAQRSMEIQVQCVSTAFVPCGLQPGQARQGHGGRESGGQEAASFGRQP